MKRVLMILILVAVAVMGLLSGAAPVAAQSERILDFQSVIAVHTDATMTVTEHITVQATGH